MKFSLTFTVFVCVICFIFIGCVAKEPQKPPQNVELIEMTIPKIGTVCEWNDNIFGKKSVFVGTFSKEIIDGEPSYLWQNPELNTITIRDLETMSWKGRWSKEEKRWSRRAKPHNGSFQTPLWVGKSYPANYYFKRYGGWSGQVRTKVKIEGWETVTVPAGTFKALKIVQGNKHFKSTNWYVPALSSMVKWHVKNKKGVRSGELVRLEQP